MVHIIGAARRLTRSAPPITRAAPSLPCIARPVGVDADMRTGDGHARRSVASFERWASESCLRRTRPARTTNAVSRAAGGARGFRDEVRSGRLSWGDDARRTASRRSSRPIYVVRLRQLSLRFREPRCRSSSAGGFGSVTTDNSTGPSSPRSTLITVDGSTLGIRPVRVGRKLSSVSQAAFMTCARAGRGSGC